MGAQKHACMRAAAGHRSTLGAQRRGARNRAEARSNAYSTAERQAGALWCAAVPPAGGTQLARRANTCESADISGAHRRAKKGNVQVRARARVERADARRGAHRQVTHKRFDAPCFSAYAASTLIVCNGQGSFTMPSRHSLLRCLSSSGALGVSDRDPEVSSQAALMTCPLLARGRRPL